MFDTDKFFGKVWAGELGIVTVPPEMLKIIAQIPKEEFAPGVWAGTEGLQLTVTKVDLTNRIITLELTKDKK